MKMQTKRRLVGTAFIAPWLIGLLAFFLVPVLQTLWFSFHTITPDANGYTAVWEGLKNYRFALTTDAEFPKALLSSLWRLLGDVPFVLIFSFFVSVLLHKKTRGSAVVKAIFFLTVILSTGVFPQLQQSASGLQSAQLDGALAESGTLSTLLEQLKIDRYLVEMGIPQSWADLLTAPMQQLFSILSGSGIQIFIFLAALGGISPSLYESSKIEGATAWEQFWKITFPMLSPMILVNTVYTVVDSFFSTQNAALRYVQNVLFRNIRFGYGSALAWIYFAVVSVLLLIVIGLMSRRVFYYDK